VTIVDKSFISLIVVVFAIFMPALPTVQAADIDLSDSCSLADAITAANTDAAVGGCPVGDGADTISLSGDITLDAALPHITSEITIEGGGYTISGNNRFRIFAVNGGMLMVNSLTMTNGKADWGGAVVNVNKGTVSINNCELNHSEAVEGGAIGNDGTFNIVDSVLSVNSAVVGGAIHNIGGTLNITGGSIDNNTSEDYGGAIYSEGGTLKNTDVMFNSNQVVGRTAKGGAIGSRNGRTTISGVTFTNNASELLGGAIYADGQLLIVGSTFEANRSSGYGGAVYCDRCLLEVADSRIRDNVAEAEGGGISHLWGTVTISLSTITKNRTHLGGGIGGGYDGRGTLGKMIITNSTISNNTAHVGGGIHTGKEDKLKSLEVIDSVISGNIAVDDGGGMYLAAGTATLTHVTVVDNNAMRGGGIFRNVDSEVKIKNSIIAGSGRGDCFGRLSENTGNLIEDGSCFPALMGDPMLGELVEPEDGSPPYYPLLEGSPAIDAADDEYCSETDIIGTPRPQGAGCDIGAYELPQ